MELFYAGEPAAVISDAMIGRLADRGSSRIMSA